MAEREKKFPIFEICTVLSAIGIIFAYRDFILSRIGIVFSLIFGKDLSARSSFFQWIAIIVVFSGIVLVLMLADRIFLRKIKNEWNYTALLLLLSIPAIQTLIICANQILRRDDYWEIADAHSYGFPGSMIFEITNHNGRYLSWGIKSLYAFLPPIPFINILLFLNIGLLTADFYLLAYELISKQIGRNLSSRQIRIRSLLCSGAFVAVIIPLSSNPWEVWFWGSGTWVYGLTISLCVFTFTMTLRIANGVSNSISSRILTAVTCFLACGGSELSTVSLAAFLFYLLIWKRIQSQKWDKIVLFYLAEVLLCSLSILFLSGSVTAAGEFAAADVSESRNFLTELPEMLLSICDSLWRYTTINAKILIIFLFVFFMIGSLCCFEDHVHKKLCLISLLLVFTSVVILLLNVYIDYVPARVITIPLCWIFSALALLSLTAGSIAAEKTRVWFPDRLQLLCGLLVVFCYSMFYAENISLIRQIRESWMIRDASLSEAFDMETTVKTCSLPTLGSSHNDLEKDPSELYNIAMRMYLRVPAVTADKVCPPFDSEPWK